MRKKGVKNPDVFFDYWRSYIPKNNSFGGNVKEKELDCDNIDGGNDAFSIFVFSLGVMLCVDGLFRQGTGSDGGEQCTPHED